MSFLCCTQGGKVPCPTRIQDDAFGPVSNTMTAHKHVAIPNTDLTVSYLSQGDSSSQPILLFLHGNLGTKSWWQPLFDILPDEMYLLAPDLRGCGATQSASEDFRLQTLLEDLDNFIKTLDLSPAPLALVAHSTSCPLAIEFSLRFGHLLHCLVLVGCPPLAGIATPPEAYRYLQQAIRDPNHTRELLGALLPHLDPRQEIHRTFMTQLAVEFQKMSPKALDGLTRNLEHWECMDRIHLLRVPLLLVRGEDDEVASHVMTLQTLLAIPSANNLEVIKGAGHAPMIENARAFAARLIDFVYQDSGDVADELRSSS